MTKKICILCLVLIFVIFPITVYGADNSTVILRFPVGEPYYFIDNMKYSMDAGTYISDSSSSTMVPVKYLVEAMNIGYQNSRNQIHTGWDSATNASTLYINTNKSIQFTASSSIMFIDSTPVQMLSASRLPSEAEIKGEAGHERMYVPFRAFGMAVGVPVDWDEATRTAIYTLSLW